MSEIYDFTTVPERLGHDAVAVDITKTPGSFASHIKEGFSPIPMWVADMNFVCAPPVLKAMEERLKYPTFGYYSPRDEYYDSIIRWQKERHGAEVPKEAIGYDNGVLGGLSSALRAFTEPGDPVLLHYPTYIGFTGIINSVGRKIIHTPLQKDEEGVWRMDYEDTEKKIRENHIHFAVFCSPHNPAGRLWEREEILQFMEICRKHDVIVFSDEIWSDIILFGGKHVPTQSVSEDARMRTIAAYAPSKTFNLAGLIGSYHVVYNHYLRERMERAAASTHYNSMNVLSQAALIGAYSPEGAAWADQLREVISENVRFAWDYIRDHFPGVSVMRPQATYMMFLDCAEYLKESGMTADELLNKGWDVGVLWQDGRPFGGDATIRLNLASPKSMIEDAMNRLKEYVF